jgi:hypothetical protein
MTARVMKQSKHRDYRRSVKVRAIALKGGRCERCGFADERALRFHHTRPVRRGFNGLRKQAQSSTKSHLAVVRGEGKGVRLLCANCSCIDISRDWTLSFNIKRTDAVTVRARRSTSAPAPVARDNRS